MLRTSRLTLSNGRTLRVARQGQGETIVFLHGYPENLQVWSLVAAKLSNDHDVVAVDWPGMGGSDPWPGGVTPMSQAERLIAILDELKIPEATLVGSDMGGQPALVAAAKFPERVKRVVAMNCLAFADEATSWDIRLLRKYGLNKFILMYLPALVFKRAEATFLPSNAHLPTDIRADMWTAFKRETVRDFIVRLCAGYQGTLPSLPALYRRIGCPALILWGDKDRHFPIQHARRLQGVIPGATLRLLTGGEHWMMLDRPDQVALEISFFIKNTP